VNVRAHVEAVKARYPVGITHVQALLIACSALDDHELDPYDGDDATVLLRAETLVEQGAPVRAALAQARAELDASRRKGVTSTRAEYGTKDQPPRTRDRSGEGVIEIEWPKGSGRFADYTEAEYAFMREFVRQYERGEITCEEMVNQVTAFHDLKVEFGLDVVQGAVEEDGRR
jgi:hypothetical protein